MVTFSLSKPSQPGSAHSQGHGQGEIPERHKAEPSYPMTARQTEEKGWQGEAAAARPPTEARKDPGPQGPKAVVRRL